MKKMLFGILMLTVVLALAACGCKHEETKLINVVEASCTAQGYTGDTFCVKCEKTISQGETIEIRPHTEGELVDAKEPTCIAEGYTGDTYCTECGEKLTEGESIPPLGHTEGEVVDVSEPTCTAYGYTGDTYCTKCGEKLTEGESIPPLGHTEGELVNASEPTCSDYGYTGDVFCTNCNEIIHQGEIIDMLEHTPGDLQNVAEATCYSEGYTGDVFCTVCGSLIVEGDVVPMLPHTLSDPYDVIEATCIAEGYTGTRNCTVCNAVVYGETIAKTEHNFIDNICSTCEWRVPGLYIDDKLEMTWEQLIQGGYVEEKDNELKEIASSLYGTLVIREGLVLSSNITSDFHSNLNEIYLPQSVTVIPYQSFHGCTSLQKVRMFGVISSIGDKAFSGCSSLQSVEFDGILTEIGADAFNGCESLESIALPDSVQKIGNRAFKNCSSLTAINLPDGLIKIGEYAFGGTGITELVLPASVKLFECYGEYSNRDNTKIQSIDMSKASITELEHGQFQYCKELESVKLSDTLREIGAGAFADCPNLKALILPQNVEILNYWMIYDDFEEDISLKMVVWPVSLIDGHVLATCPNLETIYYSGSEFQWTLTKDHDAFENINIIYNYEGDGSEFIS